VITVMLDSEKFGSVLANIFLKIYLKNSLIFWISIGWSIYMLFIYKRII